MPLLDVTPRPRADDVVYARAYADLSTALAAAAGKTLALGAGTFTDLANLQPAAYTRIVGEGLTELLSPASPTAPVIDVVGVAGVVIEGVTFAIPSGTASGDAAAVRVRGGATDTLISDISGDGFVNTVHLAGDASGTAQDAVFTITLPTTATGGTWKLGFSGPTLAEPEWLTGLAHTITASDLNTALETLSGIDVDAVSVTGGPGPGTPLVITFGGTLAGVEIPDVQAVSSLTGTGNLGVWVTRGHRGGGPFLGQTTLRRVIALNSPSSWGIHVDATDDLILEGVRSRDNWLDGIKLRRRVRNAQIIGGDCSGNGVGWRSNATLYTGDGIDTYPGGERVRIVGASFNRNAGNGLQIKNDPGDDLSGLAAGQYGLSRDVDLIGVEASGNMHNGVALTTNEGSGSLAVRQVSMQGGIMARNGMIGVTIDAINTTLNGVKAYRNGTEGFRVGELARFVDLHGVISTANGSGAGTGIGLSIRGRNVTVEGGQFIGVDTDAYTDLTDPSTLTKYHASNINVAATAKDVRISFPYEAHNSAGRGIVVASAAERVQVWQRPTEASVIPSTSLLQGSPGSLMVKDDATDPADRLWVKIAGANNAIGTWRRVGGVGVNTRSADYTTLAADDVVLVNPGASDKTITLITAVGNKGITQTIKRGLTGAGNVIVDGNSTETIDGAATKTLGSAGAWVELVSDGTNWLIIGQGGTVT